MIKQLFLGFLFLGVLFSVSASYTYLPGTNYHFDASITLANNDFSCDLVSGTLISGTPCSSSNPAYICPNAQLKIKPSVSSFWVAQKILSPFPSSGADPGSPCFSGAVGSINWLSSTTFDQEYNFGYTSLFTYGTQLPNHLNTLGGLSVFKSHCLDYSDGSIPPKTFTDRKGQIAIFGKGDVSIDIGTGSKIPKPLGSSSYDQIVGYPQVGTFYISTEFSNVKTMAITYPDTDSKTLRLYYFTETLPSFDSQKKTAVVYVKDQQPTLAIAPFPKTSITVKPGVGKGTWLQIYAYNTGDLPIEVTGVSATSKSGIGEKVTPYSELLGCLLSPLGLPCITSNGFSTAAHKEVILPSTSKNLYVWVEVPAKTALGTYTPEMQFTYTYSGIACSQPIFSTSYVLVVQADTNGSNGSGDNYTVALTPPSASLPVGGTQTFTTQCYKNNILYTCNNVKYTLSDPSIGKTSGETNTGVIFTANKLGSTSLIATETPTATGVPVAFAASIIVGNNSNGSNGGNGGDDKGACKISPSSLSVPPGAIRNFIIQCQQKDGSYQDCTSVSWDASAVGTKLYENNFFVQVKFKSPLTSGNIVATVDGGSCTVPITAGSGDCIELS